MHKRLWHSGISATETLLEASAEIYSLTPTTYMATQLWVADPVLHRASRTYLHINILIAIKSTVGIQFDVLFHMRQGKQEVRCV